MPSTSDHLFLERCEASFRQVGAGMARAPLREVSLLEVERFDPIRRPRPYRGQRHLPGVYWFASTASHLPYESLLELSALVRLDFDPDVEAASAQPFWLHLPALKGRSVDHAPDFFAALGDGRGRLIDVSLRSELSKPRRARAFELTRRACRALGWEYEVMTEPDPTVITNLRALAGFRRQPAQFFEFAAALIERVGSGATIGELSGAVGPPGRVRPVLFHLIWRGQLAIDLARPLRETTVVISTGGG